MPSEKHKLCLICGTEIEEHITVKADKSKQLITTCLNYLHAAIITESVKENVLSRNQNNALQMCQNCYEFASELTQSTKQMKLLKKKISDLTVLFSVAIFHRKGQSVDFEQCNQNINDDTIQINVSGLPKHRILSLRSKSLARCKTDPNVYDISNSTENSHEESFQDNSEEVEVDLMKEKFEETACAFSPMNDSQLVDTDFSEEQASPLLQSEKPDVINRKETMGSKNTETGKLDLMKSVRMPKIQLKKLQISDDEVCLSTRVSRRKKHEPSRVNYKSSDVENDSLEGDEDWDAEEKGSSSKVKSKSDRPRGKVKNACQFCTEAFKTKPELRQHQEQSHPKEAQLKCSTCEKIFKSARNLRDHQITHTGERNYKCTICTKAFTHGKSLKSHLQTHPENNSQTFKCELCPKEFKSSYSLKVHTRIHTGELLQCTSCGKTFSDRKGLNRHERTHEGDKRHKCSFCGKAFLAEYYLKRHERIHTKETPFECSICGKKFIHQSEYIVHLRRHAGDKRHVCAVCGKSFLTSTALKKHGLVHNPKKPYKCPVCEKVYSTKFIMLQHHRARHTGETPYTCSFCDKTFTTSHQKLRHHRKVHKEQLKTTPVDTVE